MNATRITTGVALLAFFLTGKLFAQNVNQFTGSYSQDVPLLTVPSDRGNGIPISAGYNAGIATKQGAGEIGLGWNLSAGGAIYRQVSGVPDDTKNQQVYDPNTKAFVYSIGSLYFQEGFSGTRADIYSSTYNCDSLEFQQPDYDSYSIGGPGIGGAMSPKIFHFGEVKYDNANGTYSWSANASMYKKPKFMMSGDFADTLISRHYPTTPISGSTSFMKPADVVSGDFGNRYPFLGKTTKTGLTSDNLDTTNKRLGSQYFIEYFTNAQVATGNIAGMINFETGFSRPSATYPADGIGYFRITTPDGMVYHYALPVYTNYIVSYNYPLNNDYTMADDYTIANTGTVSTNNYTITHTWNSNQYVTEYRENLKYAYAWMLTAITGPDYDDTNDNNVADAGDAGYWVNFDNQLWTRNFKSRYPAFGFDYSFNPDEHHVTVNSGYNATGKFCGKMATAVVSEREIFYLNKIKTNSHTALFVRDYRNDEHSVPDDYDKSLYDKYELDVTETIESWTGTMTDDNNGAGGNYSTTTPRTKTIKIPTTSGQIAWLFKSFSFDASSQLKIYEGTSATGTPIATYSASAPPSTVTPTVYTFTNTTGARDLTFQQTQGGSCCAPGFELLWYATGRAKVVPQLSLSKIILMDNDKMGSIPSITSMSASNTSWTLATTTYSANTIYNNDWYSDAGRKATIDAYSLQTIELTQDYTLAKKYHNNVHVTCDKSDRLTTPYNVQNRLVIASGQTANSGKLSLKEINTYELAHTKKTPSIKFDYNDASSTDNPDYDPRKTDYWGYYKSDVTDSAFSAYTTTTSKDFTDAWSLRKITTPMGGTIEIDYESNSYNKVWKEGEGTQGPQRIYHIKSATNTSGTNKGGEWDITMEESVSDFTDILNNIPATPTKFAYIPWTNTANRFQSSGTFTMTTSPSLKITAMATSQEASLTIDDWYNDAGFTNANAVSTVTYKGNGYLCYSLPAGTTVYGGGPRVKTITRRNGSAEAYVTEYVYSNGVARAEADRFSLPKLYRVPVCTLKTYNPLRPFSYDKHKPGGGIGYSTVSVKDKGAVNANLGETVTTFITDDNNLDNYKVRLQKRKMLDLTNSGAPNCNASCYTGPTDSSYIFEVINKGGAYFGMVKEKKITDVNNNIISVEKFDYANTDQGAMVELFDVVRETSQGGAGEAPPSGCQSCIRKIHKIYILRNYPVVNTKQTNYARGISSYVETVRRDEITGQATMIRSVAPNKSITVTKSTPAFRISNYANMGPKSLDTTRTNQLNHIATQKTTVDSTITGTSDFLKHEVSTFTKTVNKRYWDSGNSKFANQSSNYNYWMAKAGYVWAGQSGSLDDYGLYKQSELSSNAFNFTTPSSSSSHWRFNSELTLVDGLGHTLENRLFNNHFTARKFGYTDKWLTSSATNCNYASFSYTGFEESQTFSSVNYSAEIQLGGSKVYSALSGTVLPKTGEYFQSITNGTAAIYKIKFDGTGSNGEELGLLRNRYYRASVWVHTSSTGTPQIVAVLNGTWNSTVQTTSVTATINDSKAVSIGSWKRIYVDIFVPADYTSAGGGNNDLRFYVECTGAGNTAYFDDFMIHPVESSVSAKVYDSSTGRVTADINNDDYATYYIYDEAGRVTEVWADIPGSGKKKVKRTSYNFGRGLN